MSSLNNRRQAGVALVVVILIIALATVLVSMFVQRNMTVLGLAAQNQLQLQSHEFLFSAEALGTALLGYDLKDDEESDTPSDHCGEIWASEALALGKEIVPGVRASGVIQDLQGRFNLNAVVERDSDGNFVQVPFMVQALARLIDLKIEDTDRAQSLAEELADWIDTDVNQEGLYGKEDSDYRDYRTANLPITHASEMRLLYSIDELDEAAVFEKLMIDRDNPPRFKVDIESVDFSLLPPEIKQVNINTAPWTVIAAMTGLTEKDARELAGGEEYGTVDEFMLEGTIQQNLNEDKRNELKDYLAVRSEYFEINSMVELQLGAELQGLVTSGGGASGGAGVYTMKSRVYRPKDQSAPVVFYRELKPAGTASMPDVCNYGRG